MAYDFKSLSPLDFEDLARDLVGADIKKTFEAFGPGRDGGMDGRHSTTSGDIILQAKHYADAGYTALKSRLKTERAAVKRLKPKRYILVTSVPLSPDRKSELMTVLKPFLRKPGDIYDRTQLNSILRLHPELEKSHFKLWLTSTGVLERILRAATEARTAVTKTDIQRKLKLYVTNKSIDEALSILERQHVVIISGSPGVGKTTLGEMLANLYVGNEYRLITIDGLREGFEEIDDRKRQLFFFDDFLGKVRLNEDAIRYKDSQIASFIKRVKQSPNARFVLTTRQYIFERARQVSEVLSDERISISKYVLDVGSYTRKIRAKIVYNHLLFSDIPFAFVRALVSRGSIAKIIDHKHFNPRLVEWMTDVTYFPEIDARNYPRKFLEVLDHPERLWDHAFREHIHQRARHLLIALFFFQYGATIPNLRSAFDAVHPSLSRANNFPFDPRDFEIALREVEGSFVTIADNDVNFINPSVADYLSGYLADVSFLTRIAACAPAAGWVSQVWDYYCTVDSALGIPRSEVAKHFAASAAALPSLAVSDSPDWFGGNSFPDRLQLLLDWWDQNPRPQFSRAVAKIARKPARDFDQYYDAEGLAEVIVRLKDNQYRKLPKRKETIVLLEQVVTNLLTSGAMNMRQVKQFRSHFKGNEDYLSEDNMKALRRAVRIEIQSIEQIISGLESTSELDSYESDLKENAKWAKLPLPPDLDEIIERRRSSILDDSDDPIDPDADISNSDDEAEDDEINQMFESLVDHLKSRQ